MTILEELKNRKILKDITNENKFEKLPEGSGVYIGFDPTAKSLHLGNYLQISLLLKFKQFGYDAIAVLGGATGMIGDPSGKNIERNLINNEVLINNKNAIRKQLESFGLKVIDNYDFYKDMNAITFFREVGKLININYMLAKDVVSSRLGSGISFTEFAYQLIQGWDFKSLYEEHGVKIQIGGSDQWGNITTGIEIIRKTNGDDHNAIGITTNLLKTKDGKKFGKSEGNAMWLDKEMSSPFALYQFLISISDEDLESLFNWLTTLSIADIKEILNAHAKDPKARIGQKKLAFEIIKDIHSESDAMSAESLTNILFGEGDVKSITVHDKLQLEGSIPTFENIDGKLVEVLTKINAASSFREATEFIENKAIEIDGEIMDNPDQIINIVQPTLIRRGKKKYYLIK